MPPLEVPIETALTREAEAQRPLLSCQSRRHGRERQRHNAPLELPIDTKKEAETQMLLGLSIESRRYCAAQKVIKLVIVMILSHHTWELSSAHSHRSHILACLLCAYSLV